MSALWGIPYPVTAGPLIVHRPLRILREAGLTQGEIEGPRTRYRINADGLAALRAGVAAL